MSFKLLSEAVPIALGQRFKSFVSGEADPDRYILNYYRSENKGQVYAHLVFGPLSQGPPGHVHGGAISAIFDELMGVCCWVNGYPALTAQYTTRFLKPVPLGKDMLFSAWIKDRDANKIVLKCELIDESENRYAEGKGLFISQDISTFEQMSKAGQSAHEHLQQFVSIQSGTKE
ncbi:MAG: PaaI family thioesterase [Candidatus Marinimicrobia bacterium]|nr:PaaI family thioesterase [Candidatus Neomarinimicrobiota bacterium]MCF7850958.1 PaaI family thioesterase [Candidatus Neomarinimicrobiota bacterium]MCF7905026.1 PaaI family thioesterase [Candidatus Neomarinimicrobiota bacterium]